MDRLTRHELKQDDFREAVDQLDEYLKTHLREILTVAILGVVVVGTAVGLKYYLNEQEIEANAELAVALRTFGADVGNVNADALSSSNPTVFLTAKNKYQKAFEQFSAIQLKYRMFPRPKAVNIARYHMGICESLAGNSAAALSILTEVSRDHDKEIASLGQFGLAGEFLKTGKKDEALKIYQNLADHPTLAVPKASAQLGMADALKDSQPERARQLYAQIQRESGSSSIAEAMREQMAEVH
jgi:predicted negative regulator of RcsB-dependent stress response